MSAHRDCGSNSTSAAIMSTFDCVAVDTFQVPRPQQPWFACCNLCAHAGEQRPAVSACPSAPAAVCHRTGLLLYVERARRGALQKAPSAGPVELGAGVPGAKKPSAAAAAEGGMAQDSTPEAASKAIPRPSITVATVSPLSDGKPGRRSARRLALNVRQRLFGSPSASPDSSPRAPHSPALTPGGPCRAKLEDENRVPASPPCYPMSPNTAAELSAPEVERCARRRAPSRFQKESECAAGPDTRVLSRSPEPRSEPLRQ